jgi:hypothetical protein
MFPSSFKSQFVIAALAIMLGAIPTVRAADYLITASGPFLSMTSDSDTFDGTSHGTLPSILDPAPLEGGSFRATFRFTAVTPDVGENAYYELPAPSGMTCDLLDSAGNVVHHAGKATSPNAYLSNNAGGAPYIVDQVLVSSDNALTGTNFPTALPGSTPDVYSVLDLSWFGYVDTNVNYLDDLSIPTDAAIYNAFPNRVFDIYLEFDDGDFIDQIGPYQYVNSIGQYQIDSLTVTQVVPEPITISLIVVAPLLLLRRHHRANVLRCSQS